MKPKPPHTDGGQYIIAWTSGHKPPKTVYYQRLEVAWKTTYDRNEATRFTTRKAALKQWRALHRYPEDYEHCITEGSTRIECISDPELLL